MDDKLIKAILAMDSYNRGYNAGIRFGIDTLNSTAVDGVTQIGNAIVYKSANTDDAQAAGFYAIAYTLQSGETVVSYRGTDQFLSANAIGGDIANTYLIGAGAELDATLPTVTPPFNASLKSQGQMAVDFYQAVYSSPHTGAISVTGHSMGGGLAGV